MGLAQTLHKRAALLEFAERSRMKPYILSVGVDLLAEQLYGLTFPSPHLLHLLAEEAGYGDAGQVQVDDYVIHFFVWLWMDVCLFLLKHLYGFAETSERLFLAEEG